MKGFPKFFPEVTVHKSSQNNMQFRKLFPKGLWYSEEVFLLKEYVDLFREDYLFTRLTDYASFADHIN
jgi:hypothetical protein